MAGYKIGVDGKEVVTDGELGKCRCGRPADTEIQIGWVPEANAGAGGGQYEEACWDCLRADEVGSS